MAKAKRKLAPTAEPLSRSERAMAFMESFNKKMKGRACLKRASDYTLPFLTKRLPTGLLSVDLALRGGFPAGGLSQIAGPKNSAKSWFVWQVIRQLQYILGDRMNVLLAMTEMRADRSQARLSGVKISLGEEDIEQLIRAREIAELPALTDSELADLREEVGTIHELHGMSAEDLYDGILTGIEDNIYHLIVIDSFGSIMSAAEAESESVGDKHYCGSAGVNTQFLRKLAGFLTMDDKYGQCRDTCIIGINQVRDNIKDPNKPLRSPGGHALEHAQFVNLQVTSGRALGNECNVPTPGGSKRKFIQTGKEVNWKIEKGKAGIHEGKRGTFVYDFQINNADFYIDTLVTGLACDVIEQAGAWFGIPNEDRTDFILRCQGGDAFVKALIEDTQKKATTGEITLLELIRKKVFQKNGIFLSYNWD
jgi:RecA/RadA recombinase